MRERAQASVETVAIMAVAVALAAALALGVVRLGPPFASALREALSGVFHPGAATAPGLDDLERALLAGAAGADADGPTVLDVRAHLRLRLGRTAADTAFAAALKPLVARALQGAGIRSELGAISVVDRAAEDQWVRDRLHPGRVHQAVELGADIVIASRMRVVAVALELANGLDEPGDPIPPGHAAGDVVVRLGKADTRGVVLRRRPGRGLAMIGIGDVSREAAGIGRP